MPLHHLLVLDTHCNNLHNTDSKYSLLLLPVLDKLAGQPWHVSKNTYIVLCGIVS